MKQNIECTMKTYSAPVFSKPDTTGFVTVLRSRVETYFRTTGLPKRGGKEIILKVIIILAVFIVSYGLMLSNRFSPVMTLVFAMVVGLTHTLIVFGIAHDASHQALFNNRKLNKIFTYSFNLVGGNAYLWNITHNQIHHTYPNVGDYDTDIHQQAPLIRVSPTVPFRYYHRFQPYYAPLLYLFYSLFLVFQKDYQDMDILPKKDSQLLKYRKHPSNELIIFFASKVGYIIYTVIIPFLVIDVPWQQFLLGFITVHFMMSFFLSLVLIPVHMVDEAPFAQVDSNRNIQDSWAMHVIKNTTDYSRKSKLANWFFGGLNTHLVHHLFPGICHVHYMAMSEILCKTAMEYSFAYREVSMKEAVLSHFRLLKRMSRP